MMTGSNQWYLLDNFSGLYLCAAAPQGGPDVSFTLRSAGHTCPLTLHDNGFISICSSTPGECVMVCVHTCVLVMSDLKICMQSGSPTSSCSVRSCVPQPIGSIAKHTKCVCSVDSAYVVGVIICFKHTNSGVNICHELDQGLQHDTSFDSSSPYLLLY